MTTQQVSTNSIDLMRKMIDGACQPLIRRLERLEREVATLRNGTPVVHRLQPAEDGDYIGHTAGSITRSPR